MRFLMFLWCLLPLLFCSCSGLQRSEEERLRQQNAIGERIYRMQAESHYKIQTPSHQVRDPYPWERV